ncbi:MAG: NAD(+) synthase [Bacteroidetes bacterium HGW-Bacteroidetes-20]|nr:MAG: NAD(+) synthase [Bacteroidetes bacterium HGW-Bacteroidetes-20]
MKTPDSTYFPFITSENELRNAIVSIREDVDQYIKTHKLQSLVLGISGGIDSALCAALLAPVCKKNGIPLIGRSITIESNKKDEIERSMQIGAHFCDDFAHLDQTTTFLENKKNLIHFDDSMVSKLRQGNLKARMRMMMLYDLAQLYRGLVISTDNYTEFLTGFWTLHGDVGDYGPIMNLWKTEVFYVSTYLLQECTPEQRAALQACIDATPVDGLGISSSDCEQLGVTNYYEADKIFESYFNGDTRFEAHPIIKRYHASHYKRENPVEIKRVILLNR